MAAVHQGQRAHHRRYTPAPPIWLRLGVIPRVLSPASSDKLVNREDDHLFVMLRVGLLTVLCGMLVYGKESPAARKRRVRINVGS